MKVISGNLPYRVIHVDGSDSKERIAALEVELAEAEKECETARKKLFNYRDKTMLVDITEVTGRELAKLLSEMKKEDVQLLLMQMRRYLSLREEYDKWCDKKGQIKEAIMYYSDPKYLLVEAIYQEKYEGKKTLTLQEMTDLITIDDELTTYQRDWYDSYRNKGLSKPC